VTTGFVHVDSIADPYRELVVLESRLPDATLDGRVDGYYWCVAVGTEQLLALGGPEALRAVCEVVEDAVVGGQPGALCLISSDPADLSGERLLRWRETLRPVLRPGYPGRLDMLFWPKSAFSRPVRLFEGMPAPAAARSVLTYGEEPEGPELPLEWATDPDTATELGFVLEADKIPPDVAGAVAAVVHAWAVSARHAALFDVEGPREVTATPLAVEGSTVRWAVRGPEPLGRAVVLLLRSALQDLARELERGALPEAGPVGFARLVVSPLGAAGQ
jgi:hypothetical protein